MLSRRLARVALALIPIGALTGPLALSHVAFAVAVNPNPITITPDTFDDVSSGASCANGHAAGKCSLRAAVQRANSEGGDNIQLLAGTYTLSIEPTGSTDDGLSGDLDVVSATNITGAGAQATKITSLDPSTWSDRILEYESQLDPTVSDLTVDSGRDNGQFSEANGGGVLNDGGSLTLHNVVLSNDQTTGNGGGVASSNGGQLTITNSTFKDNIADGNGGGLYLDGSTSTANSFTNLYLTGNRSLSGAIVQSGGGAIYDGMSGTGSVSFADLMIVGNHAPGMNGGGIYDDSTFTSVPYTDLTLSGNDAGGIGGGFYAGVGHVILTNATITGNSVANNADISNSGNGGGVGTGRSATVTINNSTINANHAPNGSGGGVASNGFGDAIALHNTILVKNTGTTGSENCFKGTNAALTTTGYNLADDTTCNLTATGDRQGSTLDPALGPLQDNGGPADGAPGATSPTLTEALPQGSIAIDTADPTNANNPATDERHVARPVGPRADVGAFEFVPVVASPTPTPALPKAGSTDSRGTPGGLAPAYLVALLLTGLAVATGAGRRLRRRGR